MLLCEDSRYNHVVMPREEKRERDTRSDGKKLTFFCLLLLETFLLNIGYMRNLNTIVIRPTERPLPNSRRV